MNSEELKKLESMTEEEREDIEKIQLDAIRKYCLICAEKQNTTVDECNGNDKCSLYCYRFGVDFKEQK